MDSKGALEGRVLVYVIMIITGIIVFIVIVLYLNPSIFENIFKLFLNTGTQQNPGKLA